jgi:ATP-binding cassette subfamily F protein 3
MKIVLDRVGKAYGSRLLFQDLGFEFRDAKKTALVGPNGCGKSTLLSIIDGRCEPDSGRALAGNGVRAFLEQELALPESITVFAAAAEVFAPLKQEQAELETLQEGFDTLTPAQQARFSERFEDFRRRGGFETEQRVKRVLTGLGFPETDWPRRFADLSGGQKRRCLLARALLVEPELLLLDEPTNHLDLETIDWLTGWLAAWQGTVLMVTHDRHLIDRVADEVVELEDGTLYRYTGGYEGFRKGREERRRLAEKRYEMQAAEIARQEEFIRRNLAGQKTKQAQSRRRMLERIERLEPPPRDRAFRLRFSGGGVSPHVIVEAADVEKAYDGKPVLCGVTATAYRGEKIGLVGRNGTGKSTLLRLLLRLETPDRGKIHFAPGVRVGYFPQEGGALDPENTLLEELRLELPSAPEGELRSHLGAFLFSGDAVDNRIASLSGGEKSRLLLLKLMLRRPEVLILDEPTNHLDLPSCLLLENTLAEYEGTLFVVSHDRRFLDEVIDTVYHLREGRLERLPGNISDNEGRLFGETPADPVRASAPSGTDAAPPERERTDAGGKQALRGANRYRIGRLEEEIHRLEEAVKLCETELTGAEALRDGRVYADIAARHAGLQAALAERYGEWEAACIGT